MYSGGLLYTLECSSAVCILNDGTHEALKKDLAKLRKRLATDTRETARKDHF